MTSLFESANFFENKAENKVSGFFLIWQEFQLVSNLSKAINQFVFYKPAKIFYERVNLFLNSCHILHKLQQVFRDNIKVW